MKRRFILLLFLSASFLVFAQSNIEISESGYFVKMNNTLNLRFDIDNDVRSFVYDDGDVEYSIEPNTRLRLATAINYRFLSLKIGFSPKFLESEDSDLKGPTKVFRLTLDMFIKDVMQTLEYNQVKGYYIKASDEPVNPILDDVPEYVQLPDLKTLSIRGITRYRFNEDYSFKAVVNQNEIQLVSSGSFIPSLEYGYFEITDDTGPEDIKSFYFVLDAGYSYTFVFSKHWYSNLGLRAGLGAEFNKTIERSEEEEISSRSNNLVADLKTNIGLGYNSKKFYGGTAFTGSALTRDDESAISFDNVRGYFKVYVGYRFNPPKSFEKGMDWVEDKNPFKKK